MTFTFLCLNAWQGNRVEGVLDFIRELNPDVVALQEVTSCSDAAAVPQYRVLELCAEQLPLYHRSFAPASEDPVAASSPVLEGNLVLSKFPIKSSAVNFFDLPYHQAGLTDAPGTLEEQRDWTQKSRNYQDVAIAMPSGVVMHVVNTHGIWGHDDKDNERRQAMARVLAAAANTYELSILCGDMNVGNQTGAAGTMREGRTDVFAGMLTTSFNMQYKNFGTFPKSVVDMVFVSPRIQVVSKSVPTGLDITDHVPLVCTLQLP